MTLVQACWYEHISPIKHLMDDISMPQRIYASCSVNGCDRQHKARGYCAVHYQKFKRDGLASPDVQVRNRAQGLACSVVDCENPAKSLGFCKMHYARQKRHGTTDLRSPLICSVQDCGTVAKAQGLCGKHYYRQKRTGTLDDPKLRVDVFEGCGVGGCTNIAVARGMCGTHYKRWKRHAHVLETRASDWGARDKHPLYGVWNSLMRYHRSDTVPQWHDLWSFVSDVGERPDITMLLTKCVSDEPYGPTNFYWRPRETSGHDETHRAQRAAYMRKWIAANPEKLIEREMRKRYGIGFADYARMFDAQDGKCAICERHEQRVDHRTGKISRLAVDHCHVTGRVRALLCHKCNNGLAHFKESAEALRRAITYLASHGSPVEGVLPNNLPGESQVTTPGLVN